jgi:lipopolysaccharide export system permease protein
VHKKYSIPTACVVFILVGAPLGILIRQRGWAVAGGLSFGFFMIYWICLIGGEILADRQIITPFLAMWSPNIIVGIIAMILVAKSISGVEISLLRRRMK